MVSKNLIPAGKQARATIAYGENIGKSSHLFQYDSGKGYGSAFFKVMFLVCILGQTCFVARGQQQTLDFRLDGKDLVLPWSLETQDGVSLSDGEVVVLADECSECLFNLTYFPVRKKSDGPDSSNDPDPFGIGEGSNLVFFQFQETSRLLSEPEPVDMEPIPLSDPVSKRYAVADLGTLEKAEYGSIQVKVYSDPGSSQASQTLFIRVRFTPLEAIDAIDECLSQPTDEFRLECLLNLQVEPTSPQYVGVEEKIEALEASLDAGKSDLQAFRLLASGDSLYALDCKGCTMDEFEIAWGSGQPTADSLTYKVNPLGDIQVTVSSREWPISLGNRTLSLKVPSVRSRTSETLPAERNPSDPGLSPEEDVEGSTPPVADSSEVASSPRAIPGEGQEEADADALWTREIVPHLGLESFIYESAVNVDSLMTVYLAGPSQPDRAWIARAWIYRFYILAGMIALLFIINIRKERRRKVKLKNRKPTGVPAAAEVTLSSRPDPAPTGLPRNKAIPEEIDLGIKIEEIKQEDSHVLGHPAIRGWIDQPEFIPISMEKCWADTAVSTIFLHRDSVQAIDDMVKRKNSSLIESSVPLEQIPEIGGFLLGKVARENNSQYAITVEKFVPITPEMNNRYTVKFGDLAWSELDDAQRAHKDLRLIGWFHTHPGHGLFLSGADLNEHRQLFRQRYQIAIEIDPCTSGLETAFFTWTKYDDLNNHDTRITTRWWSFSSLNKRVN